MKKLVTVVWSVTIAVDLPENTWQDNTTPEQVDAAIAEAWPQVQKGDGEVTDVQEID